MGFVLQKRHFEHLCYPERQRRIPLYEESPANKRSPRIGGSFAVALDDKDARFKIYIDLALAALIGKTLFGVLRTDLDLYI